MTPEPPSLVGLRQEEALALLGNSQVRIIITQPPKPRIKGTPVGRRVICHRKTAEGEELLVVTPEWIDWRRPAASEETEPL